jgi:hypothetical protein
MSSTTIFNFPPLFEIWTLASFAAIPIFATSVLIDLVIPSTESSSFKVYSYLNV